MMRFNFMSLSIRIFLFVLLVVEGIEMNPGPRSKGGNPGASNERPKTRGRGSGRGIEVANVPNTPIQSNPALVEESYRQVHDQPTLNEWFPPSQLSQSSHISEQQQTRSRSKPRHVSGSNTIMDDDMQYSDSDEFETSDELNVNSARNSNISMNILLDIQRSVKRLDKKFDKMEKSIEGLKKENGELKAQNDKLQQNVLQLQDKVSDLSKQNNVLAEKYENLENQSRRENLKFYNVDETAGETWDNTEQKVRNYIQNDLKINSDNISIERAHRLPGKFKPRPIIVKFSFYKDRERILRRYRELTKANRQVNASAADSDHQQNRSNIRVGEDFSERVRKQRALLFPFMKQAFDSGKKAFLKYDKLSIDGKTFTYDQDLKQPVPYPIRD